LIAGVRQRSRRARKPMFGFGFECGFSL